MSGAVLAHDWFPHALPSNASLGERTWCYSSFSFLHCVSRRPSAVRAGDDTGIYHGTFFDLGPDGEVEIGNFVTVVGAIICTNSRVSIGDYAFLSHEVVLADSFAACPPSLGAGEPSAKGATAGRRADIFVGRNSWIGARAILLGGAVIGEGAIVGAAAVVDFDVPAFSIVAGNPAKVVGTTR